MNYIKALKQNEDFEYWIGANDVEIAHAERELGIIFPTQYKKFLSECGMCNFGDVNIIGIAKDANKISYPIVELTMQIRNEINIADDLIVLSYDVGEYLTLYKVSKKEQFEDAFVFGTTVSYDENQKMKIGKMDKIFDSFQQYFEDFIELGQ
jgi:hypothetical protein